MAGIRGLDVDYIEPERIVVNPDGMAARPTRFNPNVPAGGSAEARAFRASRAVQGGAAAAPAARVAAGGIRALMNPTTPIGMAATAAGAVAPMASAGRDRGAGRDFADPNAGNVEAGDLRPGQLGAIRTGALRQASGESLRAAYADPAPTEQSVGATGAATQQRANEIALANTPPAPVGAAPAGGVTALLPAATAARSADPAIGPPLEAPVNTANPAIGPQPDTDYGKVFRDGNAYSGRGVQGVVNQVTDNGATRAPRGGGIQSGAGGAEVAAIEQRALDIERGNSELRRQIERDYGPGGSGELSGGYATRLAERETQMRADSLRTQARLTANGAGRRGSARAADLEASARAVEGQIGQADAIAAQRDASTQRDATARGVAELSAGTQRRGQDMQAAQATQQQAGTLAVERERGNTARDVARLAGESRVDAAGARGVRPLVVDMGEEIVETAMGPQKVKRPAVVLDAETGQVLSVGGQQTAAQPRVSQEQAQAQARAAIAQGADKAAVNKRLGEMGFAPLD